MCVCKCVVILNSSVIHLWCIQLVLFIIVLFYKLIVVTTSIYCRNVRPSYIVHIIRSTLPSRPNKVGLKCPYVRPSTKRFLDFSEIRFVGSTRQAAMHNSMQYDPIQGQGHESLKVRNSAIFKGYLLPVYNGGWQITTDS